MEKKNYFVKLRMKRSRLSSWFRVFQTSALMRSMHFHYAENSIQLREWRLQCGTYMTYLSGFKKSVMRKLFIIVCTINTYFVHAQVETVGMKQEFSAISKLGRLQGAEGLQSYSSGNVKGSRFFLPDWTNGKLISTSGENVSNKFLFLFDKTNQALYIKPTDSNSIYLVDKTQIALFQIGDHQFIPGTKINGVDANYFYEVIASNQNGYSLYKLTHTKFVKASHTDLERIKMGDFDDEYKDDISYYLTVKGGSARKIILSEKKILQAIPDEKEKITQFYKQREAEETSDHFAAALIDYLNNK